MEMKSRARAMRRHHKIRLAKKRRFYGSQYPAFQGGYILKETPAACSCWMCGNPRKWFGEPTIQEKKWMQDLD